MTELSKPPTAGAPVTPLTTAQGEPAWLPHEAPLPMPDQDFSDRSVKRTGRIDAASQRSARIERAALVLCTMILTVGFTYELYSVLSFAQMTPFQFLFLILSTLAFAWIALGSMSAAMGFLPLFAGESPDVIGLPTVLARSSLKTALLFPIYHEEPSRLAGTIEAIAEDLNELGRGAEFDVFILSDTRSAEAAQPEVEVFSRLTQRLAGKVNVYYRRREKNTAKKAGNIKDWVTRFGAAYPAFVILDADSIMSGETLVRLALGLAERPKTALIQTVPRLVGGRTLFQKLQEFAAHMYGPAAAAGIAVWARHQGNYWGHNAIIRSVAFAEGAGLPNLPGPAPFGGPILSHDFVEASLMQRRGWHIYMVPDVEGSYEGSPPGLIELIVRDRRWAQGNLQHLALIGEQGLSRMGRTHLIMGALAYIISSVWAASLIVGLLLALQGQHVIPSYFYQDSRSLFPIWPVIDPGAAFRLFLATMAVVLLPKLLGFLLEVRRTRRLSDVPTLVRVGFGVLVETVFSALFAPILMVTQTVAVIQILAGFDSGWSAQSREKRLSLVDAFGFHRWHTLVGVLTALVCWYADNNLAAWMSPIILGLSLSVPISWLTAKPAGALMRYLLANRDDLNVPPILARADRLQAAWARAR